MPPTHTDRPQGHFRNLRGGLSYDELDAILATAVPARSAVDGTEITGAALRADLARVRERGYALDPGSGTLGLTGIAVALPAWAPGDPPLALGVAVPSEQADDARVATVAEALAEAAGRLTNPWRERAATERP